MNGNGLIRLPQMLKRASPKESAADSMRGRPLVTDGRLPCSSPQGLSDHDFGHFVSHLEDVYSGSETADGLLADECPGIYGDT